MPGSERRAAGGRASRPPGTWTSAPEPALPELPDPLRPPAPADGTPPAPTGSLTLGASDPGGSAGVAGSGASGRAGTGGESGALSDATPAPMRVLSSPAQPTAMASVSATKPAAPMAGPPREWLLPTGAFTPVTQCRTWSPTTMPLWAIVWKARRGALRRAFDTARKIQLSARSYGSMFDRGGAKALRYDATQAVRPLCHPEERSGTRAWSRRVGESSRRSVNVDEAPSDEDEVGRSLPAPSTRELDSAQGTTTTQDARTSEAEDIRLMHHWRRQMRTRSPSANRGVGRTSDERRGERVPKSSSSRCCSFRAVGAGHEGERACLGQGAVYSLPYR